MTRAIRAARQPVAVGVHGMVGNEAVVRRDGLVQLNGELWRARSTGGEELVPGEHVRVEEVEEDLRLVVGSVSTPTGEEPD
jgi:membrane-bound ClpP family serine protease